MAALSIQFMASYNFINEPEDDLTCVICLGVAENPRQHGKCGRLLCKKCLGKLGKDKPCPNCRESQPQYFPDGKSKSSCRCGKFREGLEIMLCLESKLILSGG